MKGGFPQGTTEDGASVPLVLAWPTAGTRRCLAESVAGFAENAAKYGRRARFVLASDSGLDGLDAGLAANLKAIEERHGLSFQAADRAPREAFIKSLEKDFSRETLEYCLRPHADGPGWGVNVNASLLAAAGGFLVSTDDDIFCRPAEKIPAAGPPPSPGPRFSNDYLAADLLYYKDREALLAAVAPKEVDVFGSYLDYLETEDDAGKSEVLVASPGIYGDSAMGRNRTVLALAGKPRDHLVSSGYETLRYSRELVRIPDRDTLSPSPQLLMTQTGFDDREPLPPFLPVGRNPDGLFAVLLRLLRPSSLTACLSFGLYHDPPENRASVPDDLVSFRPGLAELLMALAVGLRRDRFLSLGLSLEETAGLRTAGFVESLHGAWSPGARAYADLLEGLLDEYGGKPEAWAEDVKEHLSNIYAMLREPAFLFGETGCGLSIGQVRNHTAAYGRLLGIWPDLHEAAKALAAEGRGLTRPF